MKSMDLEDKQNVNNNSKVEPNQCKVSYEGKAGGLGYAKLLHRSLSHWFAAWSANEAFRGRKITSLGCGRRSYRGYAEKSLFGYYGRSHAAIRGRTCTLAINVTTLCHHDNNSSNDVLKAAVCAIIAWTLKVEWFSVWIRAILQRCETEAVKATAHTSLVFFTFSSRFAGAMFLLWHLENNAQSDHHHLWMIKQWIKNSRINGKESTSFCA